MGKRLLKKTVKKNIPLRVAAVLLCLTLFSTCFTSGLFARYTTTVQRSDTARVAKFLITASAEGPQSQSQSIDAGLAPGEVKTVPLIITNQSEVAVEYTVEVARVTKNLPLTLRMQKEGASDFLGDASGIKHTERQLPGEHTDKYLLTIDWPVAGDSDRNSDKMGMVDYIAVKVTATQID